MTVGENIRTCRQLKGLTQRELADRLNVKQQMIGQWEKGGHSPKLDTLMRIAKAMDVDVEYLTGEKKIDENDFKYGIGSEEAAEARETKKEKMINDKVHWILSVVEEYIAKELKELL